MKHTRIVALLLVVALVAACGSARPRVRSDDAIQDDVRSTIAGLVAPTVATNVLSSVNNGTVTLIGNVPSEQDRRKIGDAVLNVKGVKQVVNNLAVSP